LAVQFISIKEAGFNRKATRGDAARWLFYILFVFNLLDHAGSFFSTKIQIDNKSKYFLQTGLVFRQPVPTSDSRFL
jgi:hypothetical protein